jgi:nucleotide-binding universal stress UspA family protein/uncharacterized membrane protein (DUF485 family)
VATKEAVRIAKEKGATLVILNVIEQEPASYIEQVREDVGMHGGTGVDGVAFAQQLAKEAGLKTEVLIKEGAVTGEIVKTSEEAEVSMIVMGSSNPRGLAGLYLGDVAEAVTKRAKISVFIIKPTDEEIERVLAMVKPKAVVVEEDALYAITHSKKFKVGLFLFIIYGALYTVFTALGTYGRDIMKERVIGLNVGIIMGISVILLAIIMAVTFNHYAVRIEREGK